MMTQENLSKKSVFGLFHTQVELESAIMQLKQQGFERDDISVVMPRNDFAQNIAHENETKAPEGASIGATSGLVLGGTLGWLVGAGVLAVTGLGPLVAAGPLLAALAGASVGGALGGIGGALVGLGIPEYEAKKYESAIKDGGTLIAVHVETESEEERAKSILKNFGAKDISAVTDKASDNTRQKSASYVPPTTYPL